ncbi:hypothetical protein, partial [Paracoccus pantotrophus]
MTIVTPSSCAAIISALIGGIVAFIAAVISLLLGAGVWMTALVYFAIANGTFGVLLVCAVSSPLISWVSCELRRSEPLCGFLQGGDGG